jgi:protocatechuate 3,4-dioxygenase beta subunit
MTATCASLLAGGSTFTAGAAETVGPGWIEGYAVDGDGRPVVGALVNVLRSAEVPESGLVADRTDRRTRTAADGSFRVRQGAGGYLVQLCRPDPDVPTNCRETVQGVDFVITYVGGSGTTNSWVLQQSLLPATATDRSLGDITVQPEARLAGTLAGARTGEEVRLMRLNATTAFRTWTDRSGRYTFDGLVPGRYYVAAGGTGELPWSSARVSLRAGSTTRVDGTLDRGATIHGRVRDTSGPVARTEVLINRRGGETFASATTDRNGRFTASGLRPGRYVVGIPARAASWQSTWTPVAITAPHQVAHPVVRVRRGGRVVVTLREAGPPAASMTAELRDGRNRPVLVAASDGHGAVTFGGLRRGRYTLVGAGRRGFGVRAFSITGDKTVQLGALDLDRQFLSIRGRTAPRAVVEATTGDLCPPDGRHRFGAFHEIEVADAHGNYRLNGLVPGRYMLGADGWPGDRAPRCWSGVRVSKDLRRDLPLKRGTAITGRLVYADTSQPVVTSLSYDLLHRPGLATNPTEEHPARGRTIGATGRFEIKRLTPGSRVTGRLAREAGEGINDESFFVTFPFQDGTPYWLDTAASPMMTPGSGTYDLGDIQVATYGRSE